MQTHELQIIGEAFDSRLSYIGGLYFYDEDVYQSNPQTFGLPIQFLVADPTLLGVYTAAGFCDESGVCRQPALRRCHFRQAGDLWCRRGLRVLISPFRVHLLQPGKTGCLFFE